MAIHFLHTDFKNSSWFTVWLAPQFFNLNGLSAVKNKIGLFDLSASTADGNKFDGSEGKGVQLELGKDLFLKGFDEQLIGVKKNDTKILDATLPANHPKKELANKKTKFECKILNVKKPKASKIDDEFAKLMGAKDIKDLKSLIEKQISGQYSQALNSITKKEILDQIEKNHQIDLPQNLIDQEISIMTQNLKPEDKEKHKSKILMQLKIFLDPI